MSKEVLYEIVKSYPELDSLFSADKKVIFLKELCEKFDDLESDKGFRASISKIASARSAIFSRLTRNGVSFSEAADIADRCILQYEKALENDKTLKVIGDIQHPLDKSKIPVKSNSNGTEDMIKRSREKRYQKMLSYIADFEMRAENEEYSGVVIQAGENDVDVIEMAKYMAKCALRPVPPICEKLGVDYIYEVFHTTRWFACQVGVTTVAYVHKQQNRSSRRTYNHFRNPQSLLWIGVIMGESDDTLIEAAKAMEAAKCSEKSNNANLSSMSAAVRKIIPFDRIMELWCAKQGKS